MSQNVIRILLVEDLPEDAELAKRELAKAGIEFIATRVETKNDFLAALDTFYPDLVISDYSLPQFDGMEALKLSLARDRALPFILLTGSMNEETAVACMKTGATDYVIKEHLTRLPFAVKEALEQATMRIEKERAERALRESEERYRGIVECSMDHIFLLDLTGMFVMSNGRTEHVGVTSGRSVVGWRLEDVYAPSVALIYRSHFDNVVSNLNPVTFEHDLDMNDGNRFHSDTLYPIILDGRLSFVGGICRDITARKEAEAKLVEVLGNLRTAVRTTIQVLVLAVETRDPYTAGHQRRVVHLARAIATAMKLPQEKIEGIRMAGAIHDIGKISIPTEILSKPATLSAIEYALVKAHAQYGYEILKDVESPWPLAEMVHQHHERMNGSGYPLGLKGDEILLEARILAVADVVESMASHRPYRPALGIDAALEEIEKNTTILYDPEVVNTCVRLFREKGFSFDTDAYPAHQ